MLRILLPSSSLKTVARYEFTAYKLYRLLTKNPEPLSSGFSFIGIRPNYLLFSIAAFNSAKPAMSPKVVFS
ncbi:MAG: hypothetical protein IJ952_06005, partial [Alistipes sp.]|nr:hypothetical protein [Alistipes sp.]